MGSPEKPIDVEMGDMSESAKLNPDVEVKVEQEISDKKNEARFTGLKKEELLEISNQPKWVRARWVLFIIFWLIWIAMLVGAILIVVQAPRCKPEPEPQWYQDTVVYEADVVEFDETFEGMKKHLPYVESLNAKALLVVGAADPKNPASVMNDVNNTFKGLVTSVHDKDMKILVDLVVDTLSTSSTQFVQSATAACTQFCDMFVWEAGKPTSSEDYAQWVWHDGRNESYKASKFDTTRAFINYGASSGIQFFNDAVKGWLDRDVDGVQIRNLEYVQNTTQKELISETWQKFFTNESDPSRALFVYSSAPNGDLNPITLPVNQTNTGPSPVIVNALVPQFVNTTGAGGSLRTAITQWRLQSRSIGGFVVSPLGGPLAADRFGPEYAAGASLLSIALPGVPIIRSGDEMAALSGVFNWTEEGVPEVLDDYVLKQTRDLTVKRVEGIQALQSLRFDTRNNDTTLTFLDVDNLDIVAFVRKWDQKKAVLVVSNMSPNSHVVNVALQNGLLKEGSLAENAKVLVSSSPSLKTSEGMVELKTLNMMAGATVVLE